MLQWLAAHAVPISASFGFVALVCVLLWWTKRGRPKEQRPFLLGAIICLALVVLVLLQGWLVETEFKRVVKKLHAMVGAVREKNVEQLFRDIAPDFDFNHLKKEQFRERVQRTIHNGEVRDIVIWDEEMTEESPTGDSMRIEFKAKPKGSLETETYFLIRARFVKGADGEWRLQTFQVFNPYVETKSPLQVPGY